MLIDTQQADWGSLDTIPTRKSLRGRPRQNQGGVETIRRKRRPPVGIKRGRPKGVSVEWHEHCPHAVINSRRRLLESEASLWLAVMDRLLDDTRNAERYAERCATAAKQNGGGVKALNPNDLRDLAAFWGTAFALEELCDRLNSLGVDRFRAVEIRKALAPAVDALPGLVARYGLGAG